MVLIENADLDAARHIILEAFRKSGAQFAETARLLGCHRMTLRRWIYRLELQDACREIQHEAAKDGWLREKVAAGGRPVGSTDSYQRVRSAKPKRKKARTRGRGGKRVAA